ncbi:sugar ABC transporter permease [Arenimonas soli]|uniref:Sugar ABC transporter permease n=1 Tax=Arenimonas soli TaxID=2269504 RepID=A0ABQ1HAN3_9GAMM|nr:ABC transporter permease [Arenimonas soli]GGA66704.1 sugar ABC transporter permease [Arenimonas soli]
MLFKHFRGSLREPEFWAYSSWLDIVTKYRRSRLGLFWLLVPVALYTFGVGWFFAHLTGNDPYAFIPHLGIGFVLFRLLSTVINESTSVLPNHSSFVLDGHTRLTDFVMRVVAKAAFYFLTALPLLAIALAMAPNFVPSGLLAVLPLLLVALLNVAWIGVVVSLLGARFPDMHELMGSTFVFAFILTPILWQATLVPEGSMRSVLMRINPLFHMIEAIRAPVLGEQVFASTYWYLGIMTVAGWSLAWWLYRRYARFVPLWV